MRGSCFFLDSRTWWKIGWEVNLNA
jgi:hypothetical protein